MVLCDKAPTPGNFKFAKALPTSACVTPAFERISQQKKIEKKSNETKKTVQGNTPTQTHTHTHQNDNFMQ